MQLATLLSILSCDIDYGCSVNSFLAIYQMRPLCYSPSSIRTRVLSRYLVVEISLCLLSLVVRGDGSYSNFVLLLFAAADRRMLQYLITRISKLQTTIAHLFCLETSFDVFAGCLL